jgi:hypothetical protein
MIKWFWRATKPDKPNKKVGAMDAKEIETATDAIRARVWSRRKRAHLARTVMDLNISLADLEAFAQGTKVKLSEPAMHALTKEFFVNARFDPVADRLVEPKPLATVMPSPYDPRSNPAFVPFDPNQPLALRPEKPEPERPNPFKRLGFVT